MYCANLNFLLLIQIDGQIKFIWNQIISNAIDNAKRRPFLFASKINNYFLNLPPLIKKYQLIINLNDLQKEYLEPESGYFQPAWMVNYPGPEVQFTR